MCCVLGNAVTVRVVDAILRQLKMFKYWFTRNKMADTDFVYMYMIIKLNEKLKFIWFMFEASKKHCHAYNYDIAPSELHQRIIITFTRYSLLVSFAPEHILVTLYRL